MNHFIQNIRFKNSEMHKERACQYIRNLQIKEDVEYQCEIKPYKKDKTDDQRGYYFSTVVIVALKWQGLTFPQAHIWLKNKCCERVYFSTLDGESHVFIPSVADMKIDVMARYIDTCINFLGSHGQAVPPPRYKER